MSDRSNRPVPDELWQVREQMRTLKAREEELRQLILANPDVREGASWLAEVRTATQQRTDWKELKAMHPTIVEQYTFPIEIRTVVLSGITEDGELISARAMRKAQEAQS